MSAPTRPVLVTIPISHYCEKARWALERAGVTYEEQAHLPAVHRVAVRRAGGGLTAPVLRCPGGDVLAESSEIIVWADALCAPEWRVIPADPPAAEEAWALADDYDERLGPATRLWVYHQLLHHPDLTTTAMTHGVPWWQARTFRWTYRPIGMAVSKVLNIDPETAADAQRTFRAVFDEVDARLADGRGYLVGGRFSIADLTFAALSAPLIAPREYSVPLPEVDDLPAAMADVVREMSARPAGAHALRMFRDERRRPAAAAAPAAS
jgi:glutathione S-transferase